MTLTGIPSAPVDDRTASLLALLEGDPIHSDDRRRVVEAIQQAARDDMFDRVDPNAVRALLTDEHGNSTVYPACIGAVVQSLARRGVLRADGWVVTTGSRSGNNGRPARRYRLTGGAL